MKEVIQEQAMQVFFQRKPIIPDGYMFCFWFKERFGF